MVLSSISAKKSDATHKRPQYLQETNGKIRSRPVFFRFKLPPNRRCPPNPCKAYFNRPSLTNHFNRFPPCLYNFSFKFLRRVNPYVRLLKRGSLKNSKRPHFYRKLSSFRASFRLFTGQLFSRFKYKALECLKFRMC